MNELLVFICGFIAVAIKQGTPLLFGSTGEILTEKSGNLNLGIPGIMYMGGVSGVIGAFFYEKAVGAGELNPVWGVLIPLIAALIGAALLALVYSFLTITLRANQNVTGLALTTFGVGIGDFFGGSLAQLFGEGGSLSVKRSSTLFRSTLPFAEDWGAIGELFFSYGFLVYLAVVLALVAAFILRRTRIGLNLRAVGENPATADAAGINVTRYKYAATVVGGAIAGLGGLYYIMDYAYGTWSDGSFGDRGWLAIALVIFALWKPKVGILGSFLFGALYVLPAYIHYGENRMVQYFVMMLPYVVTIVVLVITSMRKKREHQPPESLGLPYFREER
ncbi:MAG: ABC transporter permease [Clostridia bacterium]|nr:ABC transporter permease [Clostridia bacterium]MBQ7034796.1 ABC transporter permease [Clostridia bacterium]